MLLGGVAVVRGLSVVVLVGLITGFLVEVLISAAMTRGIGVVDRRCELGRNQGERVVVVGVRFV